MRRRLVWGQNGDCVPYPITVRRPKEITPPEAGEIAGRLRASAAALSALVPDLYRAENEMDMTWQGQAKERFEDAASSPARGLEFLAGELRQLAGAIESIHVTIWEEEIVYVGE